MMWRRKPRLSYIGKFVRELRSGDVDAFLTRLKAFFADFPYELKAKTGVSLSSSVLSGV